MEKAFTPSNVASAFESSGIIDRQQLQRCKLGETHIPSNILQIMSTNPHFNKMTDAESDLVLSLIPNTLKDLVSFQKMISVVC